MILISTSTLASKIRVCNHFSGLKSVSKRAVLLNSVHSLIVELEHMYDPRNRVMQNHTRYSKVPDLQREGMLRIVASLGPIINGENGEFQA